MATEVQWEGDNLTSLVEDFPAEIRFDRWGVAGGKLHWNILYDRAAGAVASLLKHPDFPWLIRKSATIRREEANHGRVEVDYEGVPPETNEKLYRCSGSTATEPIESHEKFDTNDMAGLFDDSTEDAISGNFIGENGAIFGKDGKFKGWQASSDFAGVRSFLVGSLVYEETWLSGAALSAGELSELGNKDNPPASNVKPTLSGGRDWLLITADIEQVGNGSRLMRKWRASGRGGWDDTIYSF